MNKTQIVRKDAKQDTACSWNVSRSNNDNVNSFPMLGEKRVNCRTCLDLISGTDYKEKKAKLPKKKDTNSELLASLLSNTFAKYM